MYNTVYAGHRKTGSSSDYRSGSRYESLVLFREFHNTECCIRNRRFDFSKNRACFLRELRPGLCHFCRRLVRLHDILIVFPPSLRGICKPLFGKLLHNKIDAFAFRLTFCEFLVKLIFARSRPIEHVSEGTGDSAGADGFVN